MGCLQTDQGCNKATKHRKQMTWSTSTPRSYPWCFRGASWHCSLLLWFIPGPLIRTRWRVLLNFHLHSISFHLFYSWWACACLQYCAVERNTQGVLLPSTDRTFHATRLLKANARNKVFLPKITVFSWVRLEFIFPEHLAQHSPMY